ncbi:MAG: helix-turn-helix transcriptional regulator [Halobacteriaceae archaeon]
MTDACETAASLAASESRAALLTRLRTDGPATRADCEEWLDASKRTVKRSLAALEERGWVSERDGEYRVTAAGGPVADRYDAFVSAVGVSQRLQPFLSHVPPGELGFGLEHLQDAEMLAGSEETPLAPLERALELRKRATRIREVTSIIARESAGQLADRITEADLDVENVVTEAALREARSNPDYADALTATRGAEGHTLYVTDRDVPFLLGIFDDTVVLAATGDDGLPVAVVITEDETVLDWARAWFRSYRDDAREVTD